MLMPNVIGGKKTLSSLGIIGVGGGDENHVIALHGLNSSSDAGVFILPFANMKFFMFKIFWNWQNFPKSEFRNRVTV